MLRLEDVMSYDELCISALMAVSTPTHFINNGNRGNMGVRTLRAQAKFEPTGVYIGQVLLSNVGHACAARQPSRAHHALTTRSPPSTDCLMCPLFTRWGRASSATGGWRASTC